MTVGSEEWPTRPYTLLDVRLGPCSGNLKVSSRVPNGHAYNLASRTPAIQSRSELAGVAQSAERLTRNEQVRGSIPLPGSSSTGLGCPGANQMQTTHPHRASAFVATTLNRERRHRLVTLDAFIGALSGSVHRRPIGKDGGILKT